MLAGKPIVKDLVLLGGGHSHVEVLRSFGMRPIAGAPHKRRGARRVTGGHWCRDVQTASRRQGGRLSALRTSMATGMQHIHAGLAPHARTPVCSVITAGQTQPPPRAPRPAPHGCRVYPAGVRLTLVTRDVHTPYSGMLPGYVSGFYTYDDCHIDLARLAAFASARLVHDEACGINPQARLGQRLPASAGLGADGQPPVSACARWPIRRFRCSCDVVNLMGLMRTALVAIHRVH